MASQPTDINPLNLDKWLEVGPFQIGDVNEDLLVVYKKKLPEFGTGVNLYSGQVNEKGRPHGWGRF